MRMNKVTLLKEGNEGPGYLSFIVQAEKIMLRGNMQLLNLVHPAFKTRNHETLNICPGNYCFVEFLQP
jgi:hypothetical protein